MKNKIFYLAVHLIILYAVITMLTCSGDDEALISVAQTGTITGTDTSTGTDTGTATGTETGNSTGTDTGTTTGTGTGTDTGTATGTGTNTGVGSSTGTATGNPNTPPTFDFLNLTPYLTSNYLSSGFIVGTANDSDGSVSDVEYSFDGETWSSASGLSNWRVTVPVGTVAISGTNKWQDYTQHTVRLRVYDNDGSCSTSNSITFIKGLNKDFNGDGYADAIVGASGVNSHAGAAYIYYGQSSGIPNGGGTTATLLGTTSGDQFGISVASCGDINGDGYGDVIIGAAGDNSNTGAAYIFRGNSLGISDGEIADTTLTGTASNSRFGRSVKSCGDVDGDGYADVIVGACGADSSTGAAYIFHGSSSGISNGGPTSADTCLTGANSGDEFGYAVGNCGDLDKDGYADVIVGAYYNDATDIDAGAAYVYYGKSSGINDGIATSADVTLLGATSSDYFGFSVGSCGDLDNDGYAEVIVGAYMKNNGTGASYIYHGSGSGITTIANTVLTGVNIADAFGVSTGNGGDVDGDGYTDVIVGACGMGGSNPGTTYIFYGRYSGIDSGDSSTADVFLTSASSTDLFGYATGSCGDVNGDGYGDVIVGAYYNDTTGNNAGSAYIFHGSVSIPDTIASGADTIFTGAGADNYFGFSVDG